MKPPNGNVSSFERAALVGQPFTLSNLTMPVNGTVTCNCVPGGTACHVIHSVPAKCPHCQKTYGLAFNPQNGQLLVAVGSDEPQVPS